MISFQNVTYVMFLPSTVLTGLLIYVVHKKSPPIMSGYKYVIMFTCIAVYQFDLFDTLLIPKIIPRAPGFEFHGLLGAILPLEGNRLLTLFVCSVIVAWLSLLISFVWREYSLLQLEVTKLSVALQILHFLCAAIPFVGLFPMLNRIFLDKSDYIGYINRVEASYDQNYAVFVMTNENKPYFIHFLFYALCVTAVCSTYIIKAIFRIQWEVRKPRQCLSSNTIRMHKMLLRSLLWQTLVPIIAFVLPVIVLVATPFTYLPGTSENYGDSNSQMAALALSIPSLYTTVNVSLVFYFTTPYRNFVGTFLPWSSNVSTQTTHLEVNQPGQPAVALQLNRSWLNNLFRKGFK